MRKGPMHVRHRALLTQTFSDAQKRTLLQIVIVSSIRKTCL